MSCTSAGRLAMLGGNNTEAILRQASVQAVALVHNLIDVAPLEARILRRMAVLGRGGCMKLAQSVAYSKLLSHRTLGRFQAEGSTVRKLTRRKLFHIKTEGIIAP